MLPMSIPDVESVTRELRATKEYDAQEVYSIVLSNFGNRGVGSTEEPPLGS
jgi:hypothetical protein